MLAVSRIHPAPLRPWVPTGGELGAVGLAALAYFVVNFLLVGVAVALHERTPLRATLRRALPYQAFVSVALLSAAPLVVVVMNRSAALVLLFLLLLIAIYANAAISMQREHQALHDQLTGLPNRALLLRRTGEALAEAARTGGQGRFPAARSGPVQRGQRHPRAPAGRWAAAGRRVPAGPQRAAGRRGGAARRRRVRGAAARGPHHECRP